MIPSEAWKSISAPKRDAVMKGLRERGLEHLAKAAESHKAGKEHVARQYKQYSTAYMVAFDILNSLAND